MTTLHRRAFMAATAASIATPTALSAKECSTAGQDWITMSLDVSFQQVVHPVLTEEAEVAETSDSKGEPDERAQECPSDATRSRANCTAG